MNSWVEMIVKYLLEGAAVALAAYYIPNRKTALSEVAMIGVSAALTFFVLDMFAPSVGKSSRLGAGFGTGAKLVGFGGSPFLEGFTAEQAAQVAHDSAKASGATPEEAKKAADAAAAAVTAAQEAKEMPATPAAPAKEGYRNYY